MLVSFFCLQHIDKHSLLDSGILCCLIHILNAHLDPDEANQKQKATDRDEPFPTEKDYDGDAGQVRRLEILVLLLVNDNRSTAKYICKHHLIKALLMAVKDFNPDCGDSTYTMGIMDLPLVCVEVSYRPALVCLGSDMITFLAGRSWWCLA
ncbi:BEACH domain-containing protein A2-like isoform X3 [Malus sylvestris]|uniref:BEACH domain-containing protein A2-like isoform X3 n=1 Tax=Malus sylvestris TaxID=3752 RepID=UPI0021AC491C|nr:BEACH domain-containing protein A2-like isoform X3 [Malus sylvestris]XP_050110890.1 BEACH domain-containing protein A2-like isoform X3 [Malus sylvestris]XP_050110891.1 BEACH domain-containing protein A2-like isoform X3 [Malus sylvestris]XP_050110892.1 BEACH domain-containing protein A2-like isoform X3 [Malus sylvestris]